MVWILRFPVLLVILMPFQEPEHQIEFYPCYQGCLQWRLKWWPCFQRHWAYGCSLPTYLGIHFHIEQTGVCFCWEDRLHGFLFCNYSVYLTFQVLTMLFVSSTSHSLFYTPVSQFCHISSNFNMMHFLGPCKHLIWDALLLCTVVLILREVRRIDTLLLACGFTMVDKGPLGS